MRMTRLLLLKVLRDARSLLALPNNNFDWSYWEDGPEALREIDSIIGRVRLGSYLDKDKIAVLFSPTGPIQEVIFSSGWGMKFLNLAEFFDLAIVVA